MAATGGVCVSCGVTPLRADARFCDGCGSPLSAAQGHAEFKQVTVLFADVVRSMDIAAAVGAERLREIMAGLVDRAAAVVRRYGGTVDKFTGDGIMALFGAPLALEDHAIRACRTALEIHTAVADLVGEVARRDGVELRLRVGLNSGEVIAGEIGSGAAGYTAIGEQVGLAQRMESVAPPGGVMLSASTARLVEHVAILDEPKLVRIKGHDEPVAARRLLGAPDRDHATVGSQSTLVGRRGEIAFVQALLERAIDGQGAVVAVVGPPGIGKSRLVCEVAATASARGVEVFSTYCESHATEIPFRVVARLLRDVVGVRGLDGPAARAQVRARAPDTDPGDLLIVEDLLGIADPDVELPAIDPDARRRRLTAVVNAASLARSAPAVYVIEDAHWIDEVSESMLADFLAVIPQTPSLVLITYRPEYEGVLSRVSGAQCIALAPLTDTETTVLLNELLGPDSTITALAGAISETAAGNPFFVEELVRDLAERGVLADGLDADTAAANTVEVVVPANVQATIAARIDRLDPASKRTLSAAAVTGARFSRGLLESVGVEPNVKDLVASKFIDQISFTNDPEYAFHHPLIRKVAYASQLMADRAELHRRVATVVERRGLADQDAALIAEHLEAAGELHDAYRWQMRAAAWAAHRDVRAARLSWERAQQVADRLPADHPHRTAMRIAPRTMSCGSAWRTHANVAGHRFEELRELCAASGDTASLAVAMAGLVGDHAYRGRIREAARLTAEAWTLAESLNDPGLTVGLSALPLYPKYESADFPEMLRWSQRVIDLADGDPSEQHMFIGSSLALALATRAVSRYSGYPGWADDLHKGLCMARDSDRDLRRSDDLRPWRGNRLRGPAVR